MVTPKFYIFGVPDGFDMLEGTRQEISYFQRFYDGSTEDTKFTSHRDSNGNVTYTFLKYNLSSGKSRTGSFFGMSLAFSGVYCNHPLRLYELFDYVYHNHILCNTPDASKGILKPIANSDIKAQYVITRFEDRKEHINFVEKVFQHNLATDDMLTTSFYPLDPDFKNENQNLGVNLPLTGTNDDVLIASLRAYNYVTISPNWVKDDKPPRPVIPSPLIEYWKQVIPSFKDYIIRGLGDLMSVRLNDVQNYQKQTEDRLYQLRNNVYNKNNALTLETDYEKLHNQLADLYQKASVAQSGGGGGTNPPSIPIPPIPVPTPSFWDNVKKWVTDNKSKAAVVIGAVAALVVILVLIRPKKEIGTNPSKSAYCCEERVDILIEEALSNDDFIKANEIADTISDKDFREKKMEIIAEKLSNYHANLVKEIDKLIEAEQWKEAFNKAEEGCFDEDSKRTKKAEIKTACLDGFKIKISGINKSNYSSKSPGLKQELSAVKDYIGAENYQALIKELDKKNMLIDDPKPKTSTYVVEFYKTGVNYVPESNSPTQSFKSNGKIIVGNDHYIYKIKKDNVYLTGNELRNEVNSGNNGEMFVPKNDHIRLFLQATQGGNLKIGNITITVEK